MSTCLTDLPNDALHNIMKQLSLTDLCRFSRVCHKIRLQAQEVRELLRPDNELPTTPSTSPAHLLYALTGEHMAGAMSLVDAEARQSYRTRHCAASQAIAAA